MIRATVFYPAGPGCHFDFDDYLQRHVPFARRLLRDAGLRRLEVDRGVSCEEAGTPPRYVCLAHLYFDSADDYARAMALHGDALGADVPRYTNIEPFIQVSDIVP